MVDMALGLGLVVRELRGGIGKLLFPGDPVNREGRAICVTLMVC